LIDKIWAEYVMNVTSYLQKIKFDEWRYPTSHTSLKIIGKVGSFVRKEKTQTKLSKRVTMCSYVGYVENHFREVYRMLNLTSISIIWFNKMYKDLPK
jgi:hypothetical protein